MNIFTNTFRVSFLQILLFSLGGAPFFAGLGLQIHVTVNKFGFFARYSIVFPTLFAGGISGLIGNYIRHRDSLAGQIERDRRASFILERLSEGQILEYSVYLRTFGVTHQLGLRYKENRLPPQVDVEDDRDLETLLASALETYRPLIALGKPGEHIGAGRIQTEDQTWQEKIDLLMRNASTIVMIPSHREGTRWEVEWIIANNMLSKALFLMPPTDKHTKADVEVAWDVAAGALEPIGLHLPDYDDRGMIFMIDDIAEGEYSYYILPEPLRPAMLRKMIKKLHLTAGGST